MRNKLIDDIRACTICRDVLPYPPKPVLNYSIRSRIVIIGQAPGIKVHESGIPWNDASGKRLRKWLDVSVEEFYDPLNFGIVPMGFCYPGNDGKGDRPPRPECAPQWMPRVLPTMKKQRLIVLIGQYAQNFFLGESKQATLTETVRQWRLYLPEYFVLPHPSPRNNIWLRKNPWFEQELPPELQRRVRAILQS